MKRTFLILLLTTLICGCKKKDDTPKLLQYEVSIKVDDGVSYHTQDVVNGKVSRNSTPDNKNSSTKYILNLEVNTNTYILAECTPVFNDKYLEVSVKKVLTGEILVSAREKGRVYKSFTVRN